MSQHFLLSPVNRALADDEMQLALNGNEALASLTRPKGPSQTRNSSHRATNWKSGTPLQSEADLEGFNVVQG